jgi:hypothetical protein
LELFTPEDVMSLLRVMLALGRNGDVAAARVFLEYVVGKPHKAPDPDRIEHHEWQLFAEAPRLADVTELLDNGVPTEMANDATRDTVPHLAANRLDGVFDSLDAAPPPEPAATPSPEPAADTPAEGPRNRMALELLTAALRAAVANGVNGTALPPDFHRPTGDNGAGRTAATGDNGQGPAVATAVNGYDRGCQTRPGGVGGPSGTPGLRLA